jgi:hypothetical protein
LGVAVVVADRSEDRRVSIERNASEWKSFAFKATNQLGNKVLRIGS